MTITGDVPEAYKRLIRATEELFTYFPLSDWIYSIRERELLGWEGPEVKRYSRLLTEIEAALAIIRGYPVRYIPENERVPLPEAEKL